MKLFVIKGDDPTLVSQAAKSAVDDLLGDDNRSLVTEELTEADYTLDDGTVDIGPLVFAITTPPFLTNQRIILARNVGVFSKVAMVQPLVDALENPVDGVNIVLVWEKGANSKRLPPLPKPLQVCAKKRGAEVINSAPAGRGRKQLLDQKLGMAPVRLEPHARRLIGEHVGDDIGRLPALFELLTSSFGPDAVVRADDVRPFLNQAADVPPWDLTDAIDSGDISRSLANLKRMVVGGERHSLQILATLINHYQRAFRLDGSGVRDEKAAAKVLGLKGSTFPAKKALSLARQLGSGRLRSIIKLLADADLDVRGRTAIPAEQTVEVLVARLARISQAVD